MDERAPAVPEEVLGSDVECLSGVTCPSCPGVLSVRCEREGRLVFECRIGHLFGPAQLLALKEQQLEDHLAAALCGSVELVALMRDLELPARRVAELEERARALRAEIDRGQPLDLGAVEDRRKAP